MRDAAVPTSLIAGGSTAAGAFPSPAQLREAMLGGRRDDDAA
jgi:hypothetical protein